jgi:Heterokaryon incompatibility protein (HET)
MESKIYQSCPLEIGRIRLLSLQPGQTSSPIICDLTEHSLDAKPTFEALSYTWGDTTQNESILLCAQEWPVSIYLFAALQHLRHDKDIRILWIDALCINQESSLERGHQVAQMSSIYGKANKVIAWLGEGTEESNTAVEAIEEIIKTPTAHWYAYGHRLKDNIEKRNPGIRRCNWFEGMQQIISGPWWTRVWTLQEAVLPTELMFMIGRHILSYEMFMAMWSSWLQHSSNGCCSLMLNELEFGMINVFKLALRRAEWKKRLQSDVQLFRRHVYLLNPGISLESPNSSSSLYFRSKQAHLDRYNRLRKEYDVLNDKYVQYLGKTKGDENLHDYQDRVRSDIFITRDKLRDQYLDLLLDEDELIRKFFGDCAESRLLEQQAVWTDILYLIDECRLRECADPRDRIYGYLGLRSQFLKTYPILDYFFPPYKVWEDFQLEVFRRSKNLDILSLLSIFNAERDVSWLINWEVTMFTDSNGFVSRDRFKRLSWFQASYKTSSIIRFVYPCAISVRGFKIATVSRLGGSCLTTDRDMWWFTCKNWWEVLNKDREQGDMDHLMTIFCEVLMGYSSQDAKIIVQHAADFKTLFLQYLKDQKSIRKRSKVKHKMYYKVWHKLFSIIRPRRSKYTLEGPSSPVLISHATTAALHRQLIVSDNGHVGLASTGADYDDIICILFGGKLPFVLRPVENDPDVHAEYGDRPLYKIVGTSYIHGLVHGEAMQYLENGRASETDFLLI